jgi:hypothetical protein
MAQKQSNEVVQHGLNAANANAETNQDQQQLEELSSVLNSSKKANAATKSEADETIE